MKINVYTLATLPIGHLIGQLEPYERCSLDSSMDAAYRDVINAGVWGYQLHTYLSLVHSRFGKDIKRLVRAYQLTILGWDDGRGIANGKILELIDGALDTQVVNIPTPQGTIEVPVEMNVALALLLDAPESPDYVLTPAQRAEQISLIKDNVDWHFARCLSECRDHFVTEFSLMLARLELDPLASGGLWRSG